MCYILLFIVCKLIVRILSFWLFTFPWLFTAKRAAIVNIYKCVKLKAACQVFQVIRADAVIDLIFCLCVSMCKRACFIQFDIGRFYKRIKSNFIKSC